MKINLHDIMESLNGGNEEDARASLHEWFVEQGKRIQSGQVDEEIVSETEEVDEGQLGNPHRNADDDACAHCGDEDCQGECYDPVDESILESKDEDEDEDDKKEVEESIDDLVADLTEAFKGLETVSDKLQNVEGAQVGEEGKVPVNTKSTLPQHKGVDRLGGKAVEIHDTPNTGHELEKAPKVQDVKIKNTVQNGMDELKKVPRGGSPAAILNKMDGTVNTQSPISGKGAKGLK